MKMISKITYSIRQGFKGIFSNKTMSFISVISVTLVLAILGIVLSIVLNINSFMETTKNEVNEIRVAIDDNLSTEDSSFIKSNLESINGVVSVKYQTKDEAFENLKDSFGEDKSLLEGVKNPLDDYYIVTIEDSNQIKTLANKIEKVEGKNVIDVMATIVVERPSQKGILIGKGGKMLKDIGTLARKDIVKLLGTKIYLELWVKVQKDWRNKKLYLNDFGYSEKEY